MKQAQRHPVPGRLAFRVERGGNMSGTNDPKVVTLGSPFYDAVAEMAEYDGLSVEAELQRLVVMAMGARSTDGSAHTLPAAKPRPRASATPAADLDGVAIASAEDGSGRRIRLTASRHIVRLLIPPTEGSDEVVVTFGPALARQFGDALFVAADHSEAMEKAP